MPAATAVTSLPKVMGQLGGPVRLKGHFRGTGSLLSAFNFEQRSFGEKTCDIKAAPGRGRQFGGDSENETRANDAVGGKEREYRTVNSAANGVICDSHKRERLAFRLLDQLGERGDAKISPLSVSLSFSETDAQPGKKKPTKKKQTRTRVKSAALNGSRSGVGAEQFPQRGRVQPFRSDSSCWPRPGSFNWA